MLAAVILLAYALASIIGLPERSYALQLPGVYFEIEINIRTIITLLVAALTASGAEWLVREHPSQKHRSTFEHWLLPALTAWAIGVPLLHGTFGVFWIAGVFLGGGALILVLVAEYIVVDPEDQRYAPAAIGLTATSFALYLILAISLRYSQFRLFILLPALTLANGLVSLRVLHLRLRGQWAWLQTGVMVLIMAQLTTALHYLPGSPITFGLLLLGPVYALTSLIGGYAEGKPWQKVIAEPLVVLVLITGLAIWLR